MKLVKNKWYVCDQFSTDGVPTAGPFETQAAAEAERKQLNIADDCFTAFYTGKKPPTAAPAACLAGATT